MDAAALALPFLDLFASALTARGEPFLSGRTLLLLLPAALLVNVLVIPAFGAVGAAVASAAIGLAGALLVGLLIYRRFGSFLTIRTIVSSAVALLLMLGLASRLSFPGPLLVVSYAGCLAAYLGVLVLLGAVTRQELTSLAWWLPQRPQMTRT